MGMLTKANLPTQVKAPLILMVSKASEENIKEFLLGLHEFLKDADKYIEKLETTFPEIYPKA